MTDRTWDQFRRRVTQLREQAAAEEWHPQRLARAEMATCEEWLLEGGAEKIAALNAVPEPKEETT